jgi:hypothetical protein
MRTFTVILPNRKPRPISYPCRGCAKLTGEQSVALMTTLRERGHTTIALTSSEWGDEELTLEEMLQIYPSRQGES